MLTGSGSHGLKERSLKKKNKKIRMCCSFPPNVTSSTFLQQLAPTSRRTVYFQRLCLHFALLWPFAKQAVNYCGCSTFPVINISANHGQSQVRNTEAVKPDREASSVQFLLYTYSIYVLTLYVPFTVASYTIRSCVFSVSTECLRRQALTQRYRIL